MEECPWSLQRALLVTAIKQRQRKGGGSRGGGSADGRAGVETAARSRVKREE